eukprot:TRINITY_DN90784_c0_g1_i1.p1 TRINITY_DN90784_c0_g1~~TRINITY_DN90784_c0_g1_i1.p1  ORF type:complete len:592 (+),score=90.69 TRINITY_DN90784_c0_g1_i1:219-1994(+)
MLNKALAATAGAHAEALNEAGRELEVLLSKWATRLHVRGRVRTTERRDRRGCGLLQLINRPLRQQPKRHSLLCCCRGCKAALERAELRPQKVSDGEQEPTAAMAATSSTSTAIDRRSMSAGDVDRLQTESESPVAVPMAGLAAAASKDLVRLSDSFVSDCSTAAGLSTFGSITSNLSSHGELQSAAAQKPPAAPPAFDRESFQPTLRRERRAAWCNADGAPGIHNRLDKMLLGDESQYSGPRYRDWPTDVQRCLESPKTLMARVKQGAVVRADAAPLPQSSRLALSAGVFNIPHPEKAESGGADSSYIDPQGEGVGVADGVGEWEWRFNMNARAFADELMTGCNDGLQEHRDASYASASRLALASLKCGYSHASSFGSSTALTAVLTDRHRGMLGVANVGDSSLMVLRRNGSDPLMGLRCVGRTHEQQHSWNCPFQLSRLPKKEDYPELLASGKGKLVRTMQKSTKAPMLDLPEHANLYELPVQEGDLLILGSDGLFDNLFVDEMCELAMHSISPLEASVPVPQSGTSLPPSVRSTSAERVAEALALAAYYRSQDRSARTPFAENSRAAGFSHSGGKMDDVTCLVAWVVRG